jgi:hypothetical protein
MSAQQIPCSLLGPRQARSSVLPPHDHFETSHQSSGHVPPGLNPRQLFLAAADEVVSPLRTVEQLIQSSYLIAQ